MTYGQLTTGFIPTGAGTTLSCDFLYTPSGVLQTVLDGDQSAFSVTISGADVLSFNLLATVTIDGVAATSGVTVIPEGWHSMTGILDATADVDLLASAAVAPSDNFHTQLHNLILTDPLNGANSMSIDASIEAATMPSDPDITNPSGLIKYGDWIDLHVTQPYVPLLKGGAEADRAFVEFKHEAYSGDIVGDIPATNYRYYRISIAEINGGSIINGQNICGIQEIELRATPGGADLTSPGMTCIASSNFSGDYLPTNIINNNNSTDGVSGGAWGTLHNQAEPSWIYVDLGSAQLVTELVMWTRAADTGNIASETAPKNFTLDGSNDASNWTVLRTFEDEMGWSPGSSRTWDIGATDIGPVLPGVGEYQTFRISTTLTNGGAINSIQELEIRLTNGGPTITTSNMMVRASSQFSVSYYPWNILNGDLGNPTSGGSWGTGTQPDWIYVATGQYLNVFEFAIWANSGDGTWSPRDFVIEGSVDGVLWDVLVTVTGEAWAAGQLRVYPNP